MNLEQFNAELNETGASQNNTAALFAPNNSTSGEGTLSQLLGGIVINGGSGAGIGIGGLAFILLIAALIYCCLRSRGYSRGGAAAGGLAAGLIANEV